MYCRVRHLLVREAAGMSIIDPLAVGGWEVSGVPPELAYKGE